MKNKSNPYLLCLFFFLFYSPLEAVLRAAPNAIALEASYLYLRPITDYPYFASQLSGARLIGDRFANEFDYDNGYRIEGNYTFCNCDYDIRGKWTHLGSQVTKTLPLGLYVPTSLSYVSLVTTNTIPNDHRSIDYDALDLLCGYRFFTPVTLITLNIGLHWAKINFSENFHFVQPGVGDFASGEITSNMHGMGPELAFIGKWKLPFSWNSFLFLNGRLEGAMLFSHINSHTITHAPSRSLLLFQNVNNDVTAYVIPHGASSIGLSIEKIHTLHLSAEIGYTIIGYYHALDIIGLTNVFSQGSAINSFDLRDSVYFHGLYATLGITY